jgi:hypothetical protein
MQNCTTYHHAVDLFGSDLTLKRLQSTDTPLAFSHSIHQQPGILEVFLALTFRNGIHQVV